MQSALEILLSKGDDSIIYVYVNHAGLMDGSCHYTLPSNTFCLSQNIADNIVNIISFESVFNHHNFNMIKIVDDSAYNAKEIKECILKYSPYKAVEIYYDTTEE